MVGKKKFIMIVNNIIVDVFFFLIIDKGELIIECRFMLSVL